MTEAELRQKVVDTILSWVGLKEADGSHKQIIDIYNNHKPLAQGYKVKYTDAWCATTVSAVAIQCDITDIMPTECSCPRMVALYQKLGRWHEGDAYIPGLGDIIMYDWQDSGVGDDTGVPDHVGIVTRVSGSYFWVAEGNYKDSVAIRQMRLNGQYIRGFCLPDYASKAASIKTIQATTKTESTTKGATVSVNLSVLKKGSTGAQVKAMQTLINGYGFTCVADGDFGAKTEAALKKYQSANGLTADGSCGPKTWKQLLGA